jgi:hypothetical protein
MKGLRVIDIVLPCSGDIRPHPSVEMSDPISRAIELMVRHNLKDIAVVRGIRPIGRVRLQDAFDRMGLMKEPRLDDYVGEMEV